MLNKLINIDLHIHSNKSAYKEGCYSEENDKLLNFDKVKGQKICEFSNINNVDLLLNKLQENNISLFSITDHNTYDLDLYETIIEKLKNFPNLNILNGVECDVQFEDNKKTVHIIVIFNAKVGEERLRIDKCFKEFTNYGKSLTKTFFFSRDEFEKLLKKVNLDTILIVHQKTSLDNTKGKHQSLSEGVSNPYVFIKTGYIDALEYQNSHVEGILNKCLTDAKIVFPTITGSDCHDWRAYPYHDLSCVKDNREITFSVIKALPTFKGLLLSLTSPETRFNVNINHDDRVIKDIEINGKKIILDSGINAIIGENGAGKSSLFKIMKNDVMHDYVKKIKKVNSIKVDTNDNRKILSFGQTELIEKFNKNNNYVFSCVSKDDVDYSKLDVEFNTFKDKLFLAINKNIDLHRKNSEFDTSVFKLNPDLSNHKFYYVNVTNTTIELKDNDYNESVTNFKNIIETLLKELNKNIFTLHQKIEISLTINFLLKIYNVVYLKSCELQIENVVKNIIINKCNEYNQQIKPKQNSIDKQKANYEKQKTNFIKNLVNYVVNKIKGVNFPIVPFLKIDNVELNTAGYRFVKRPKYNQQEINNLFFEKMFTKKFKSYDDVKKISSQNDLINSIIGCTNENDIATKWDANYKSFLEKVKTSENFIFESVSKTETGNTLGELSLIYIRYNVENCDNADVFMIDQPEDNISSNNISNKLVNYFNSLRDKKQVIIVTHNPTLVVNLDVDNVIYLKKINNKIEAISGCLEDEENKILDTVASVLDGGKETIERRLKIYGR